MVGDRDFCWHLLDRSRVAKRQTKACPPCCPRNPLGFRQRAGEVPGLIRAAAAFPSCFLRKGTQRTRAVHRIIGRVRGNHSIRRLALLHPLFESRDSVERIRPRPAAAVLHPRNHEQAVEALRICPSVSLHTLEIVDAVERRNIGIAEAVILDQLSAVALKRA